MIKKSNRDERPIEKPVLEFPAPAKGRVGLWWFPLLLIVISVILSLVWGLKYTLTHWSANLALLIMCAAIGLSVLIIVFFSRKVSERSRKSSKPPEDNIKIYRDRVYLPSYLHHGRAGEEWLQIKHIVDFDLMQPGKSQQLLAFSVKGSSRKHYYYNTLEKHDIEEMYKTLHSLSGLSEQFSPFGKRAQGVRKRKSVVRKTGIIVAMLACCGLILFSIFYPFTRLYSGMASLGLYALVPAFLFSYYLAKGPLYSLFRKKDGVPLSFPGAFVVLQSILMFTLLGLNFILSGPVLTEDAGIDGKARVRSKSSYSYHLKFRLEHDPGFYPVSFGELSFVRTSSRIFRSVRPGESIIRVTYGRGPFGLSVIYGSEVVAESNMFQNKPSFFVEQGSRFVKREKLVNWKTALPEFKEPEMVEKIYWSPDKIKAEEPFTGGKRHGLARYTHANGSRYTSIYWVKGKKEGRYQTYREDGSIEADYSFHEGKPHGLNLWYDEHGNVTQRVVYDNGEVFE